MNKSAVIPGLIVAMISIIQLSGCLDTGEANDKDIEEGFELSKKYCGSCHQLPEPKELDKTTWAEFVLPKMAGMLGFQRFASDYISVATPVDGLTIEQWRAIVRYYVKSAPEKLEQNSSFAAISIISKNMSGGTRFVQLDVTKNPPGFTNFIPRRLISL